MTSRASLSASATATFALLALTGCYQSTVVISGPFDAGTSDAPGASQIVAPCTSSMPSSGPSRDCGWRVASTQTCRPGTSVAVGCASACGLGSCSGDAMMRVCAGTAPCSRSNHITTVDDSPCGGLCPFAEFTCPSQGTYTVLSAPFGSGSATCDLGVRGGS